MLTAREESVLRQMAQDHGPREVLNPNHGYEKITTGQYLNWLMSRDVPGPARVTAGPTDGGNQVLNTTDHVNNDSVVISRVRHVLRWKKERKDGRVIERQEFLTEFFSRTGLGKSQILEMSKTEISKFVAQAEQNNAEAGV